MEQDHPHGPENAEHEIKKAFNHIIETGVTHLWDRKQIPDLHADEAVSLYKTAFRCYRDGDRLAAERWARTAKHLSRAFWHEAKIAYFEPHATALPFLEGAADEYQLHESVDTTADLLDSLADHVPPGMDEMPAEMTRYLQRARKQLEHVRSNRQEHELLRAERIKAAHEYGRVLECLALAYEAKSRHHKAA